MLKPLRFVLALFLLAGLISASTITYNYPGIGDGSLGGVPFIDQPFAIVLTGGTTARTGNAPNYSLQVASATLELDLFPAPIEAVITVPETMFLNQMGFGSGAGDLYFQPTSTSTGLVLLAYGPDLATWNLISPIGPEPFYLGGSGSNLTIPTTAGDFVLETTNHIGNFTAVINPELCTLGMFGLAFLGSVVLAKVRLS